MTVSSDSADGTSGVDNATFQYSPAGAGTWTQIGAPDTSSPYSVTWNTSALAGSYDLRVITKDDAGNTFTSATRTVAVDSTPPTVAITFPGDGAYNAAGFNATCAVGVCGTAADASPGSVAGVTVTIRRSSDSRYWNGSNGTGTGQWSTSVQNLSATGTASWTRAFTTASLQNNVTYTVTATATDGVGLTGTDSKTFVYDTTSPTGTVTAPSNGANVNGSIAVSSNSADSGGAGVESATFEYRVLTSGPWTTIAADSSSPYSVSWDTTSVTDGQYYLRVTTLDSAGNSVSSGDTAVRVRVDNTNPTGDLTAPANNAFVKGTTVVVSSNSADAGSGVASVAFNRSPAGANTWTTIATDNATPFTTNWNTTTLSDGSYDLQAVTTDGAGNTFASPTRTVKVDNNGPTIVGNATGTVGDNGWYTTNVGLTWTVTDLFGVATQTNCGAQSVTSDTTGVSYTCTAVDNAGNSNNGTVTIKRDTVNPTGSLTAPTAGATVRAGITVSSNSADATSGVASAVFQRSPAGTNTWTTIATDTSSPYSQTWTTTGVSDGSYDLRVVTTDNAGKTFTSPTVTVAVDNTKPVPTSVELSDGANPGNGKAESGDRVTIEYSEPLDVSSLCTSWSSDTSNQSISTITATLNNSGSSDYLTLGGVCSNVGTIDTNRSYVTGSRNFTNSTVAWNVASRTLTITLGTASGSTSSGVSNAVPTYTPTTSIADIAGNTMNATGFNGTSSRF